MLKMKLMPLAIAAGFALTAAGVSAQEVVVKIGHVGPTSGNIAHLGKDNENGFKLAIEDLNKAGIKIGGKTVKFEGLTEDDAADPKQGTAAAQKLVDAKVVGVIGHLNSGTSIPASKIYGDAGVPQISPSATNVDYTAKGTKKSTFRVVANDGQLGGTLGRYAVTTKKFKTAAVIDDRTAYGQGVAAEFAKAFKKAGGKVVSTQFTNNQATDFQAILTQVKGTKPDMIFYGGMDAQAGPMLRQMKQLGINAGLMGGDGICSAELPKLSGDGMADGQVVCAEAGGITDKFAQGMDQFKKRFKERFNADVQIYAPYVYDATMVMVEAMKKANSTDPAKFLPALQNTNYRGVTGQISFDKIGDIKNGTLTLYTYKAGKRESLGVVQ